MEHKFASRFTLIGFVLAVGLFGIFWYGLKPGIDIQGGTSLIYEIKAPAGMPDPELAQNVASALKKRVDPRGVRNLVWRPQGATRLEIQMPLTEGSAAAGEKRKAFADAQERLSATNISVAEVRAALAAPAAQRQQQLESLAMGSPVRKELIAKLDAAMKTLAEAEKGTDPVAKVNARDAVADLERQILETNLSEARLHSELELFHDAFEKAQQEGKQDVVAAKRKEREAKLAEIRGTADFPARQQAIDNFVTAFDQYAAVKGSVDDVEDLKRLLRGSGVLEFHILVQNNDPSYQAMAQRLRAEGPTPRPDDTMRWLEVDRPEEFGHPTETYGDKHWALVFTTPDESMVHSDARPWGLRSATRGFDSQQGRSAVDFSFDDQGAVLFGDLTGRNINKPLAIVLDDKLISAPNINSRIESSGQITGSFSDKDLEYLTSTLSAGSLPAQLRDEPISERQIGPSIGADNLRAGFRSCIAGIVVVAAFMIGYYYLSGVVAVIAVLMNLVLILGVMAMFQATFTLPGIAGMVLTIGMAVDANVLIYERLREEQLRGLSLRMALRNAYDRAFSAILDSNLTTILTSIVLYIFGSEEVKGFGLTLAIGITSSMFTALYVTRAIFDFMIERVGIKKLGSLPLTYPNWDKALRPNIDWMGKAAWFYGISTVLIVIGLIAYFTQGRNMYDIEFVSGTGIQLELKEPMKLTDVRDMIRAKDPAAQVVAIGHSGKEYEVVTPDQNAKNVRNNVIAAMGERLDVELESKFALSKAEFDQALGKAVVPVGDEPIVVDGFTASSAASFKGGVAIVLKDLDPPLSPEKLRARIERVRLEPGSTLPHRRMQIDSPKRAQDATTNLAVVFIADPDIDYGRDPSVWQDQLARPMWRLVNDAVGRPADFRRVTSFNAQVAGETKMDAVVALLISALGIGAYIWLRFGNFKFSSATIVSLVHDVLATIGVIGVSMYLGEIEFFRKYLFIEPFRMNLTMIAAILTVMGYSVNDTIVILDRIRENRGKFGHVSRQVINDSINQTLSRTLLTGGTTIITLFVMFIWGGEGIHGFTYALLAGILVGTYSSIAIASPILLLGGKTAQSAADRRPPFGQLQRAGQ